jgi:hypothetical protein
VHHGYQDLSFCTTSVALTPYFSKEILCIGTFTEKFKNSQAALYLSFLLNEKREIILREV